MRFILKNDHWRRQARDPGGRNGGQWVKQGGVDEGQTALATVSLVDDSDKAKHKAGDWSPFGLYTQEEGETRAYNPLQRKAKAVVDWMRDHPVAMNMLVAGLTIAATLLVAKLVNHSDPDAVDEPPPPDATEATKKSDYEGVKAEVFRLNPQETWSDFMESQGKQSNPNPPTWGYKKFGPQEKAQPTKPPDKTQGTDNVTPGSRANGLNDDDAEAKKRKRREKREAEGRARQQAINEFLQGKPNGGPNTNRGPTKANPAKPVTKPDPGGDDKPASSDPKATERWKNALKDYRTDDEILDIYDGTTEVFDDPQDKVDLFTDMGVQHLLTDDELEAADAKTDAEIKAKQERRRAKEGKGPTLAEQEAVLERKRKDEKNRKAREKRAAKRNEKMKGGVKVGEVIDGLKEETGTASDNEALAFINEVLNGADPDKYGLEDEVEEFDDLDMLDDDFAPKFTLVDDTAMKYDPNQPRDPGGKNGGRWVKRGGYGLEDEATEIARIEGTSDADKPGTDERTKLKRFQDWMEKDGWKQKLTAVGITAATFVTILALSGFVERFQVEYHREKMRQREDDLGGWRGGGGNWSDQWDDSFYDDDFSWMGGGDQYPADDAGTPEAQARAMEQALSGFLSMEETGETMDFYDEVMGTSRPLFHDNNLNGTADLGPQGFYGKKSERVHVDASADLETLLGLSPKERLDKFAFTVLGKKGYRQPKTAAERTAQHDRALLITIGKLRSGMTADKSEDGRTSVQKRELGEIPFVSKDEDSGIFYAAVLVPGETDKNGERPLTVEEVADYSHGYMKNFRYMDTNHDFMTGAGDVVESFTTKDVMPVRINGREKILRKGTWVIGSKPDAATKKLIESGEITGYSITAIPEKTLRAATKSEDVALKNLLLEDLENPLVGIVSYVKNPAVKDAQFFSTKAERVSFWERIGLISPKNETDEDEPVVKSEEDSMAEVGINELAAVIKEANREMLVDAGLVKKEDEPKSEMGQVLEAIQGLTAAMTGQKGASNGGSGTEDQEQGGGVEGDRATKQEGEDAGESGSGSGDEEGSESVTALKAQLAEKDELLSKATTALKNRKGTGSLVLDAAEDAETSAATESEIKRDVHGRRVYA